MTDFPSEFRRSALANRWTLIAAGRGKRPHQFVDTEAAAAVWDPFDPDNIPPEDIRDMIGDEDGAGWKVLAMRNKFPFLAPGKAPDEQGRVRDGYGDHELVIHSPDADRNFEDFSDEQTALVLEMYQRRLVALSRDPRIKYVQIFTNRGKEAGASVVHPHSQIVALPLIPPYVEGLLGAAREHHRKHERSVVEDEAAQEAEEGARLIEETSRFLAYCPFAPRVNYHVRILPKRSGHLFRELDAAGRRELGGLLNRLHRRLNAVADVPPYNVYFRTAPPQEKDLSGFRWHVDIMPRLSIPGGLELATGIDTVTVTPEDAAAELRAAQT